MNKKQQIAFIDTMFMKLKGILDSTRYSDRYYRMCEDEEKDHRKHRPSSIADKYGIPVKTAARLFYVRNVIQYLSDNTNGPKKAPSAKDYFYFKQSIFAGYALFCEADRIKLVDCFGQEDIKAICDLDYSELVA